MGTVYAARHAIIDKRVAIKVLRKEAAADESSAQRFIIEAKAASKIGHQNIVDITDFGVLPAGNAYFVMEYPRRADARQAGARAQAHSAGARRRDLHAGRARPVGRARQVDHPSRSQAREHLRPARRTAHADFVKIVDFGIAKDVKAGKRLTAVGMVLGTPEYMSPEQATGQETDHRVDQYALGCILYEMLTGDVPFKGENAPKTLTKHVFDAVVPPTKLRPDLEIPAIVEEIVMRMLQKKPADRYADMRALIDAFEAALGKIAAGERAGAQDRRSTASAGRRRSRPTPSRSCRATRRRIYAAVAVSVAAVMVLAGVAITHLKRAALSTPRRPRPPPATARPPVTPPATPAPAAPAAPARRRPRPTRRCRFRSPRSRPAPRSTSAASSSARRPSSSSARAAASRLTFTVRRTGYQARRSASVMLDHDQTLELVLRPKREKVAVRTDPRRRARARPPQRSRATAPQHRVTDLRNPFE